MNLNALAQIVGPEYVKTDEDSRIRAAGSWSPIWTKRKQAGALTGLPVAVVLPKDTEAVAEVIRWANATHTRLTPIGGRSNAVGSGGIEDGAAFVAVDLSRLRTLTMDEESLLVHVGAGWNIGELEQEMNRHDYTLGHFPQSIDSLTVGGSIAANAVGLLAGKYGRQSEMTRAMTAVLGSGATIRTASSPLGSPYFDPHSLIIGSEGAFGIITGATLRIWPAPEARAWAVFTFASFSDGVDAIRLIHRSDSRPTAARLLDMAAAGDLAEAAQMRGRASLLLLCFEGDEGVQTGHYQLGYAVCKQVGGAVQDSEIGDRWFAERRATSRAWAANARPGGLADVFNVSAPYSALKKVHSEMRAALAPLVNTLAAEMSHARGDGAALDICFEAQVEDDDPAGAVALYESIVAAGLDACLQAGGAVAHHGGVGETRRRYFARERGPEGMAVLRSLKAVLDPNGVLNHGGLTL